MWKTIEPNWRCFLHQVLVRPRSGSVLVLIKLTQFVGKLRELVDVFARVPAVRDAEAEVEVEVLEEATLEVVALDHPEAVDWPVAHGELHTAVCWSHRHTNSTEVSGGDPPGSLSRCSCTDSRCPHGAQLEEGRGELVAHKPPGGGVGLGALLLRRTCCRDATSQTVQPAAA